MTEDEAKTKWCPFARAPQWIVADEDRRTPIAACNMGVDGERGGEAVSCIGSACMAWRESPPPPEIVGPVHGFCGLAGRPA